LVICCLAYNAYTNEAAKEKVRKIGGRGRRDYDDYYNKIDEQGKKDLEKYLEDGKREEEEIYQEYYGKKAKKDEKELQRYLEDGRKEEEEIYQEYSGRFESKLNMFFSSAR
jgi:predicted HicB family RNase H-like nuclease